MSKPELLFGRPAIEVDDMDAPGDIKITMTERIDWLKITSNPDGSWTMRRLDKRSWIRRVKDKLLDVFDKPCVKESE